MLILCVGVELFLRLVTDADVVVILLIDNVICGLPASKQTC